LHKFCKHLLPYRFRGSLVARMHNKVRSIPCRAGYILTSFLYPVPLCRMMRNDCKRMRMSSTLECRFDKYDNLSLFLFFKIN
jgi:hypothetical protein